MRRFLRSFGRVEALEELEVEVRDEAYAYLDHFCPGSERHRLLGVPFTGEERDVLRAGGYVPILFACDECIWERRIVFRMARRGKDRA